MSCPCRAIPATTDRKLLAAHIVQTHGYLRPRAVVIAHRILQGEQLAADELARLSAVEPPRLAHPNADERRRIANEAVVAIAGAATDADLDATIARAKEEGALGPRCTRCGIRPQTETSAWCEVCRTGEAMKPKRRPRATPTPRASVAETPAAAGEARSSATPPEDDMSKLDQPVKCHGKGCKKTFVRKHPREKYGPCCAADPSKQDANAKAKPAAKTRTAGGGASKRSAEPAVRSAGDMFLDQVRILDVEIGRTEEKLTKMRAAREALAAL